MGVPFSQEVKTVVDLATDLATDLKSHATTALYALILISVIHTFLLALFLLAVIALLITVNPDLGEERNAFVTPVTSSTALAALANSPPQKGLPSSASTSLFQPPPSRLRPFANFAITPPNHERSINTSSRDMASTIRAPASALTTMDTSAEPLQATAGQKERAPDNLGPPTFKTTDRDKDIEDTEDAPSHSSRSCHLNFVL
ncbi:hypothetical protein BDZ45DRAFT_753868 [Acephala macrosclerotiorum]|nr:hypothetical protein BDZ45DRAFT_753868 [Acephala macrosclerotiorum]